MTRYTTFFVVLITCLSCPTLSLNDLQCYVCVDECEDPLTTHNCAEVLNATTGTAACIHFKAEGDDGSVINKGCILDTEEIRQTCNLYNLVYPQIECRLCNTDLCNTDSDNDNGNDNESGVDQCYFCDNNCDEPLTIQNCTEPDSACITLDIVLDGERQNRRQCIEGSSTYRELCQLAPMLGGTCEICDTNLCNGLDNDNGNDNEGGDDGGESGVDQCYFCYNNCDEPLTIQNCTEPGSACITLDVVYDNARQNLRQCIEGTSSYRPLCELAPLMGGTCQICDSNLCNGLEDDDNDNGNDNDNDNGDDNNGSVMSNKQVSILILSFLCAIFSYL